MSLFVWYFGTRRRYPEVAHHTIALGRALPRLLADIFDHQRLGAGLQPVPAPADRDRPSLAPPGCDTFHALAPVPHQPAASTGRASRAFRRAVQRPPRDHAAAGLQDEGSSRRAC